MAYLTPMTSPLTAVQNAVTRRETAVDAFAPTIVDVHPCAAYPAVVVPQAPAVAGRFARLVGGLCEVSHDIQRTMRKGYEIVDAKLPRYLQEESQWSLRHIAMAPKTFVRASIWYGIGTFTR